MSYNPSDALDKITTRTADLTYQVVVIGFRNVGHVIRLVSPTEAVRSMPPFHLDMTAAQWKKWKAKCIKLWESDPEASDTFIWKAGEEPRVHKKNDAEAGRGFNTTPDEKIGEWHASTDRNSATRNPRSTRTRRSPSSKMT